MPDHFDLPAPEPDGTLQDLMASAKYAHNQATEAERQSLLHAVQLGRLLKESDYHLAEMSERDRKTYVDVAEWLYDIEEFTDADWQKMFDTMLRLTNFALIVLNPNTKPAKKQRAIQRLRTPLGRFAAMQVVNFLKGT